MTDIWKISKKIYYVSEKSAEFSAQDLWNFEQNQEKSRGVLQKMKGETWKLEGELSFPGKLTPRRIPEVVRF